MSSKNRLKDAFYYAKYISAQYVYQDLWKSSVYVFYLALSWGPQAFTITRRNECTAFLNNMDFSTNYKNGNTNLNSKIVSFVNFKNSY